MKMTSNTKGRLKPGKILRYLPLTTINAQPTRIIPNPSILRITFITLICPFDMPESWRRFRN